MAYNGWRLTEQSKSVLTERFPPRFPDVIAHHITLRRGKQFCPVEVQARVVGYAADDAGVEALVVEIDGCSERADGKTYHITWSIDREAGFKPVSSNELLKIGYTEVEPIDIIVVPFYKDHDEREWTQEIVSAVERCRAEGYEDPFFVGTKGYPNWMDFTDEAIAKTRAMVAATQAVFKPSTEG
jgi:hypothetical protein